MGVDAEVTRKWTAFSEWAKEQGIQSENVKLAEFDAGLRGVAAGAAGRCRESEVAWLLPGEWKGGVVREGSRRFHQCSGRAV